MKTTTKQIPGMVALALFLLATILTQAQEKSTSNLRVTGGFDLSIPRGKFSKNYDGGYGIFAGVELPLLTDKLYFTAITGLNTYFAKEDANDIPIVPDMTVIPVKAGVKYFFVKGLYLQAEAGISFLTTKSDFTKGKAVSFVFAPQIGYFLPLGAHHNLDIGLRYEGRTKAFEEGNTTYLIGIKAGYTYKF